MKRSVNVAVAVVLLASMIRQQAVSSESARDAAARCQDYGDAELVFVGRPQAPMRFHISGEAAIQAARQNAAKVRAEVEAEKATLTPQDMTEARQIEFIRRIIEAEKEVQ